LRLQDPRECQSPRARFSFRETIASVEERREVACDQVLVNLGLRTEARYFFRSFASFEP
jgi:hypothetical protein